MPLIKEIYKPLKMQLAKYSSYELMYMEQKLSTLLPVKEEIEDTIQTLGLKIPSIFDIAKEAKLRCQTLMENCGYCSLLQIYKKFFLGYADQYRVVLRQISRIEITNENWSIFQMCFSLLQFTGDVLINLQLIEKELSSDIIEISKIESKLDFKHLLLNDSDRNELNCLVKCVTNGTQLLLLDRIYNEFNKLCSDIHYAIYQVVIAPVTKQLEIIQSEKFWIDINSSGIASELPEYSFTPQEYITQVI